MTNIWRRKDVSSLILENIFIPKDYVDYDNEFIPPIYPKSDEEITLLKQILKDNYLTSNVNEEDTVKIILAL